MRPRNELRSVKICEHGGGSQELLRKGVLDFSANLNPYGPPSFVLDAIREAASDVRFYPDSDATELKLRIAERLDCDAAQILVAAGVSQIILLVALTFLQPQRRALFVAHTYGEYETAAKLVGAAVKKVEMPSLRINAETLASEIRGGDVVFLCNPNNPTGQYLREDEVALLLEAAVRKDALLVLDEAYVDFVDDVFDALRLAEELRGRDAVEHLLVLRSFTKAFTVPGLRVGYAVGSARNISALRLIMPPWSVGTLAQRVGCVLMSDAAVEFLKWSRTKIFEAKKRFEEKIRSKLGVTLATDANFYLLHVGDCSGGSATAVKGKLREQGVLVRDCTSFGLPSHIRFSVRREEENEALIAALSSVLGDCPGWRRASSVRKS
ncbi:MAG: Histidinol-phosphate/aromatic aminotransferase or cobyric acid decarboxylase [Candidatus Alkanophagales archaeon MCA70_species_2]|nr:Histidinol-phosphate/aromatic aminotransferase or cobyric acid decarboxylase [Candidatus Alkanophaga liquidiphilum]RLG39262.1 MAG: hypothetical protein DRN91_00225 [Candidatus Alkanophagales archaeon]